MEHEEAEQWMRLLVENRYDIPRQFESVVTIRQDYEAHRSRLVDQGKALEARVRAPMEGSR